MNLNARPVAPDPYDSLPPLPSFTLTSADMTDGGRMPETATAVGGSTSPHLHWEDFPPLTRSFVVTCFDPDAPTPSGWWHWAVVDLAPHQTTLPRGAGRSDLELDGAAFHLRVDHGEASYLGAAPPVGDRPHRYIFVVHALDIDTIGLDDDATPAECSMRMLDHAIARARLTVTHEIPGR